MSKDFLMLQLFEDRFSWYFNEFHAAQPTPVVAAAAAAAVAAEEEVEEEEAEVDEAPEEERHVGFVDVDHGHSDDFDERDEDDENQVKHPNRLKKAQVKMASFFILEVEWNRLKKKFD